MDEVVRERPLYKKAAAFIKKMHSVSKENRGYFESIKDDINKAMYKMRQAIARAYELDDTEKAMRALGVARGKTGALSAQVDILTNAGDIPKGDCIELMTLIEEIHDELTVYMKEIDPEVDEWKKDYFDEIGGDCEGE